MFTKEGIFGVSHGSLFSQILINFQIKLLQTFTYNQSKCGEEGRNVCVSSFDRVFTAVGILESDWQDWFILTLLLFIYCLVTGSCSLLYFGCLTVLVFWYERNTGLKVYGILVLWDFRPDLCYLNKWYRYGINMCTSLINKMYDFRLKTSDVST